MKPLNLDDLTAKIDNALETMCFVMADPIDADDLLEVPAMKTWISFHNESEQGFVELAGSLGFVQEVGSGLLGVDSDEVEEGEQAEGVLLELANVIAGEVVCLLGGEEVFFELGIPTSEAIELDVPGDEVSVAFDSMGEAFNVRVERGPAASQADAA
jgi:hypothetical protein